MTVTIIPQQSQLKQASTGWSTLYGSNNKKHSVGCRGPSRLLTQAMHMYKLPMQTRGAWHHLPWLPRGRRGILRQRTRFNLAFGLTAVRVDWTKKNTKRIHVSWCFAFTSQCKPLAQNTIYKGAASMILGAYKWENKSAGNTSAM